jgi:hypothetical protein
MKVKNTFFKSLLAVVGLTLFVSCTSNQDDAIKNNSTTDKNNVQALVTSHKLLINNDATSFKINVPLRCLAAEGNSATLLNPIIEIDQNMYIQGGHHYDLIDFTSASTLGISSDGDSWNIFNFNFTPPAYSTLSGHNANTSYGTTDANTPQGYYANWAFIKAGEIGGTTLDLVGNTVDFDGAFFSYCLNVIYGNGTPVGALQSTVDVDLHQFEAFDSSGYSVGAGIGILHIKTEYIPHANGDVEIKFTDLGVN